MGKGIYIRSQQAIEANRISKIGQIGLKGELGSNAKISNSIANEIRHLYSTGKYTYTTLSLLYPIISRTEIGRVIRFEVFNLGCI